MISVVIPTFDRLGLLNWILDEFNHQVMKEFEVVVINDGGQPVPQSICRDLNYPIRIYNEANNGPAAARNLGAELAEYDIIFFCGDDTIPDRNLLFRHYYNHRRDRKAKAVQGITHWHPSIATDEFHNFLYEAGLQANWKALQNQDGSWKYEANGYCLTTNFSIDKTLFWNAGGFTQNYKSAAWEDISLGYKLQNSGIRTVFDPGAANYHYHQYNLESYVRRQLTEGYWRITLCLEFPEASGSMINPEMLRQARNTDLDAVVRWANELNYAYGDDVIQAKYNRWHQTLQLASLKGILNRIDEDHPALQALEHMHTAEQVMHIINGVAGLNRGDIAYAQHCVGWLLNVSNDNWAAHCFAAHVFLESGDTDRAREHFIQSVKIAPNSWAKGELEKL